MSSQCPSPSLKDAYTSWSWSIVTYGDLVPMGEGWWLQSPLLWGSHSSHLAGSLSRQREAWGELFLHMLRLSVKQEVTENTGTCGCSDLLGEGCREQGPAWPDLPWEMGGEPKQLRAASQDPVCFLMVNQPSLQTQEGRSETALRQAWRVAPLTCGGSCFLFLSCSSHSHSPCNTGDLFLLPWVDAEYKILCPNCWIEYWESGRDERKPCSVFTRKELQD